MIISPALLEISELDVEVGIGAADHNEIAIDTTIARIDPAGETETRLESMLGSELFERPLGRRDLDDGGGVERDIGVFGYEHASARTLDVEQGGCPGRCQELRVQPSEAAGDDHHDDRALVVATIPSCMH